MYEVRIHLTRTFFRHLALASISALAIACDHPVDVSQIVTTPKAGSFDLDAGCGIVESASGGIYTLSRASALTLRVDSRNADGSTIAWTKSLPATGNSCTSLISSSGNLVVATGDSVFSLNSATGAIRWRFAASNVRMASSSTGKVFLSRDAFSNTPATVYALSENDGSFTWSRTVDNLGAPFVDDARSNVYYVRRAGAVAIDISSGTVKWETQPLGSDLTTIAAIASDGSLLIGGINDFSSRITAFAPDGTRGWVNATLTPRQLTGSPVIDDAGTVYSAAWISQFNGGVYAFSVATGATKWTHDFFRIESNVAVDSDRTVYVIAQATADSASQIYGLRDGAVVSRVAAVSHDTFTPITIHSNKLLYYVGSTKVAFIPTAGVAASAAWPVDKHDAKRSAHR